MTQGCIHAYISGKVQGVWYRAFTREQALALGITGWAKNLADGRVEVMLCGDQGQLQQLLKVLEKGPPLARVTGIEQQALEAMAIEDFLIG